MAVEVEAKLRVPTLAPIRALLADMGLDPGAKGLERNWVMDTDDGALFRRGVLLRLRNTGDKGGIVTVKSPVKRDQAFKAREEVETVTDSIENTLRQWETLGYSVQWKYEKYREQWTGKQCVIALDHCPEIGTFVEIEGAPEAIRSLCRDLGLDPDAHIADSYLGLWRKHLHLLGQTRQDMLFSKPERKSLGIAESKA